MACCEPELHKLPPVPYRNPLIPVLPLHLLLFRLQATVGLFSGSR